MIEFYLALELYLQRETWCVFETELLRLSNILLAKTQILELHYLPLLSSQYISLSVFLNILLGILTLCFMDLKFKNHSLTAKY